MKKIVFVALSLFAVADFDIDAYRLKSELANENEDGD